MFGKNLGMVVVVVGVVLAVGSALADVLGYGGSGDVFGPKQIGGVVAGLVLIVVGFLMSRKTGGT